MADILPILVATWPIKLPEREFGTGGWGSIFYHWINGEVSPCFASFAGDSLDDSFYRKEDSHYKEKCKRQTSPPPSSGAANEGAALISTEPATNLSYARWLHLRYIQCVKHDGMVSSGFCDHIRCQKHEACYGTRDKNA